MCVSDKDKRTFPFCEDVLNYLSWARNGKMLGYNMMFIVEDANGKRSPVYGNLADPTCLNKGQVIVRSVILKKGKCNG